MSRTSIDIDDKLAKEGLKITHLKTKKVLVNFALQRIMELKGKLQWDGDLELMRADRV